MNFYSDKSKSYKSKPGNITKMTGKRPPNHDYAFKIPNFHHCLSSNSYSFFHLMKKPQLTMSIIPNGKTKNAQHTKAFSRTKLSKITSTMTRKLVIGETQTSFKKFILHHAKSMKNVRTLIFLVHYTCDHNSINILKNIQSLKSLKRVIFNHNRFITRSLLPIKYYLILRRIRLKESLSFNFCRDIPMLYSLSKYGHRMLDGVKYLAIEKEFLNEKELSEGALNIFSGANSLDMLWIASKMPEFSYGRAIEMFKPLKCEKLTHVDLSFYFQNAQDSFRIFDWLLERCISAEGLKYLRLNFKSQDIKDNKEFIRRRFEMVLSRLKERSISTKEEYLIEIAKDFPEDIKIKLRPEGVNQEIDLEAKNFTILLQKSCSVVHILSNESLWTREGFFLQPFNDFDEVILKFKDCEIEKSDPNFQTLCLKNFIMHNLIDKYHPPKLKWEKPNKKIAEEIENEILNLKEVNFNLKNSWVDYKFIKSLISEYKCEKISISFYEEFNVQDAAAKFFEALKHYHLTKVYFGFPIEVKLNLKIISGFLESLKEFKGLCELGLDFQLNHEFDDQMLDLLVKTLSEVDLRGFSIKISSINKLTEDQIGKFFSKLSLSSISEFNFKIAGLYKMMPVMSLMNFLTKFVGNSKNLQTFFLDLRGNGIDYYHTIRDFSWKLDKMTHLKYEILY